MFAAVTTSVLPAMPEGYSPELLEILTLCLQRDPNRRPTVEELLDKPMFELLIREHLTEEQRE